MKVKAVIYARYSSDNQREESIEAQVRAIKEYAEKNGIDIIKTYADEARSATIDNRPKFLDMINDSKSGEFGMVLVHKLDRFARNRYDSALYRKQLERNGVKLVSIMENLDDSPESIILESVLEGMAEYYSKNLARETMKGMKETALKGKSLGGTPPFGYDVSDDKTYVINEHEAKGVRMIFDMYTRGSKYSEIINELNRLGYKTKRGNKFSNNSLHDLLKNEKYIGNYVFNKTAPKSHDGKRNSRKLKDDSEIVRLEGIIPAIIDKETFSLAQKRLNDNQKKGMYSAKRTYLLSGLIQCGHCGASVVAAALSGRDYSVYECSGRKRKKNCDLKSIRHDYIEGLVIDELTEKIFSKDGIERLVESIYNYALEQKESVNEEINYLEKKISETQKNIDNIVNAVAQGMMHESFKSKMDDLESDKSALQKQLNEARIKLNSSIPNKKEIKKYLVERRDILKRDKIDKKKIVQKFVKKVTLYQHEVKIELVSDSNGAGGAYTIVSDIDISAYRQAG